MNVVPAFDAWIERLIHRTRGNKVTDRLFYSASEAANHSMLWHGLAWAPVLFGRSPWRSACRVSIAIGLESALVNGLIKQCFRRERPAFEGVRPHTLREPLTSSFPSGHATSAFFAAQILTRNQEHGPAPARAVMSVGLYATAFVVATSRVYVGIHHASDVVAGAACGTLLGKFARKTILRNH